MENKGNVLVIAGGGTVGCSIVENLKEFSYTPIIADIRTPQEVLLDAGRDQEIIFH